MSEITVPPASARTQQCSKRPTGHDHCTHMVAAPVQGPAAMMFPKACCFCAPEWYKIVILVPHTMPTEHIAAISMQHGPMMVFEIAADPAKQIAVSGAVPTNIAQSRGKR
jgi:hypothetical protein